MPTETTIEDAIHTTRGWVIVTRDAERWHIEGPSGRHSLLASVTTPARLRTHLQGFVTVNGGETPISLCRLTPAQAGIVSSTRGRARMVSQKRAVCPNIRDLATLVSEVYQHINGGLEETEADNAAQAAFMYAGLLAATDAWDRKWSRALRGAPPHAWGFMEWEGRPAFTYGD